MFQKYRVMKTVAARWKHGARFKVQQRFFLFWWIDLKHPVYSEGLGRVYYSKYFDTQLEAEAQIYKKQNPPDPERWLEVR